MIKSQCVYRIGMFALAVVLSMLAGCAPVGPPQEQEAAYQPDQAAEQNGGQMSASMLPRVMIMVDEKSLGTIATSEVESMAVQKLLEYNVPVVNQDMVRANIARNKQILQMAGDNRGAASLGLQFGADIVLVGEAVAKPSARRIGDTNLRAYQAAVTIKAVRTDNAATLAAQSETSSQVGLEDVSGSAKVLKTAAEMTLNKLIPDMISKWTPAVSQGQQAYVSHRLEISFGGIDQMWKLRAVRESLKKRSQELSNVVQRSYTAGLAEFSLDSILAPEDLAEQLVLNSPQGMRLQVLDVAPGRIQLRAVAP